MNSCNNTELFLEEINRLAMNIWKGEFAICNLTDNTLSKLVEGDNPIYRIAKDKVLFGYKGVVTSIPFTPVTRQQAVSFMDSLEESSDKDFEPNGSECEIHEISPLQWEKLREIVGGVAIPKDSDTDWLVQAGMLEYLPSGNIKATKTGKAWVSLRSIG